AGPLLDRHRGVAVGPADPDLGAIPIDRQVALVDLLRREGAQVSGRDRNEPLALDLRHQTRTDAALSPSLAPREVSSSLRSLLTSRDDRIRASSMRRQARSCETS